MCYKKKDGVRRWGGMGVGLLFIGVFLYGCTDTDRKIEDTTRNTRVFKTYLKDDAVQVNANDGVVTLTGTVSSQVKKSLAEETTGHITGVKSVSNRIEVNEPSSERNSDGWTATKVKAALLFHRHVSAEKTNVTVVDGVVTLKGEAETSAQKELVGEYAKDVEGVTRVNNEMTVASSASAPNTLAEDVDDASITAQVKLVLLYHKSTRSIKTHVETNKGVVRLSGETMNASEKDLVTKLVKDVDGVKSVKNEMIVAP